MGSLATPPPTMGDSKSNVEKPKNNGCGYFQMPLHYPRYNKAQYQTMPEWQLDCLLKQYGLPLTGNVDQKRIFAMEAFLWPH